MVLWVSWPVDFARQAVVPLAINMNVTRRQGW